jgi:hypothetical protein
MLYAFCIFFFVVEISDLLFSLLDELPVSYVLDIEDHVFSKNKLSWSTLKTGVKG